VLVIRSDLKGRTKMRAIAALTTLGFLAACTSNVTVPTEPVIYEVVPQAGVSSTSGGALPVDATAGGVGGTPGLNPDGTPIGADRLNLNEFSLEQQKIDAALAERQLAEARSQLVVIQPSGVPVDPRGVNVALYAQQTTNPVGARVYNRSGRGFGSNCGRYANEDDAQRAFLAAGGPTTDQLGLDPDGDGFACKWDPSPYRQLAL
jgi:hypothetical protein